MAVLTPANTRVIFIFNAVYVGISILLRIFNLANLQVNSAIIDLALLVSQICYLRTLVYLLFAFKKINEGQNMLALYLFFALNLIAMILFTIFKIDAGNVKYFSILTVFSFVINIWCGTVSLLMKKKQFGLAYSLFFFSFIISHLVTILSPVIFSVVLKFDSTVYLKFIGFIHIIPPIMIFMVLWQLYIEQKQYRLIWINSVR